MIQAISNGVTAVFPLRRCGALLFPALVFLGGFCVAGAAVDDPGSDSPKAAAPEASRVAWAKVLVGEELASGREVKFFPAPDYWKTRDAHDPYDLTDGELARHERDRIWHRKEAVGWYLTAGKDVGLMVDLGKEEAVGRVAIRLLGGREQGALVFPRKIELLGSDDGKTFHLLRSLEKLMPAEQELSDFKTAFYLPEEGKAYVYPFVLDTNVKTRYIVIRMERDAGIFTDEISIQRSKEPEPKALAAFPATRFYSEGLAAFPRKEPMVITSNIVTPSYLVLADATDGKAMQSAELVIEVPDAVEIVPTAGKIQIAEEAANAPGVRRFRVKPEIRGGHLRPTQGPFYFKVADGARLGKEARCRISAYVGGVLSNTTEGAIKTVAVPVVENPGILNVSLTWMNEGNELGWPGFLENFRKMGFVSVSAFPRWYRSEDGKSDLEAKFEVDPNVPGGDEAVVAGVRAGAKKAMLFLDEAREKGYKVVANDSPFHILGKRLAEKLKAGKIAPEEQAEIFNRVNEGAGKYLNPLYRGRFFENEMRRIAAVVEVSKPDELYLDIEWWYESVDEGKGDPRVEAAWKASGKEWGDFITDVGTDVLKRLKTAAGEGARRAKIPAPRIGLYNSCASGGLVQKFFDFRKLYPEVIRYSMPSLYVQGRTLDVVAKIRADYAILKNRDIVPWLTAGTYGEFDPAHVETMVLESILNGAGGVTYYYFYDFDPMDFYYHARALSFLMKYPELMKTGRPSPWTGSNPDFNYTCFGNGKEKLLMVGNYKKSLRTGCTVPVPLDQVSEVLNVPEGKPLKAGKELRLEVPPGGYVLLHVKS